jgi:hypothetical protein
MEIMSGFWGGLSAVAIFVVPQIPIKIKVLQ